MKPRILVLYYTQTGQLRQILDHILVDIKDKVELVFAPIEPVETFTFPWTPTGFFDAMPETVVHEPREVKPLPDDIMNGQYDLVIFGYQPWFLNPSQPTTAFLKSPSAKVLAGKNVMTVVGARNMWLHAQERVKQYLEELNANLVGNIALIDTNTNLISLLTVIRWTIKGKKEASGWLPAAGVQEKDMIKAQRYGVPILRHLTENKLDSLQQELLMLGAVQLNPALILLEQQGIKNFRYWANYIREKGGPGDLNRLSRVNLFKRLLLTGIFVLSPIKGLSAKIKQQLNRKKLSSDVAYFKQLRYEKGRI